MYLNRESAYILGLTTMATYLYSPSSVTIDCFSKENYQKDIANTFGIKKEIISLEKVSQSLQVFVKEYFRLDEDQTKHFIYNLEKEAGKCLNIYDAKTEELLIALEGDKTPFTFIEKVYLMEFENLWICMMIGNNE